MVAGSFVVRHSTPLLGSDGRLADVAVIRSGLPLPEGAYLPLLQGSALFWTTFEMPVVSLATGSALLAGIGNVTQECNPMAAVPSNDIPLLYVYVAVGASLLVVVFIAVYLAVKYGPAHVAFCDLTA